MAKSRLQEELKKRHPFESAQQEAMLNILRSADQFENRIGRLFREYDLTPSQYNVLRILRGEGQPLPCIEIVERMLQVVPAMTGLLDRLEKMSLIERQRSSEDRRVVYVELTSKGRDILNRIDQPLIDLHQKLLGHLNQSELKELSRLLEKTRTSLDREA